MNVKRATLLIGVSLSICSFTSGYNWAQAWVDDNVLSEQELPQSVQAHVRRPALAVVLLPKKDLLTTQPNGNTYLRCYLINHADSTASIGRADATITGFTTEIRKDNTWQPFQRPIGVSCGNSYWTQKLESKQVLAIQLDHSEDGSLKVPFRIKYKHYDTVIYSNVITVDIDQHNYDRVGKR
jgi:hypothetical protein